jgi:hypothetical protein
MKTRIAIIIPVFNALNHTIKCLGSLDRLIKEPGLEQTFSIVVIDDGSSDGTSAWINDNYPEIIVLHGDGNLWWSGGINKGTKYAISELRADYILWWNNDVIPEEQYFQKLKSIVDTSNVIIGGSKIYFAHNPNIVWSMGGVFDTNNGRKYMIGMGEQDNQSLMKKKSVDWLPGMGTIIHKSVFTKIGFVDETNFPQYHGDSDFTFRAKLAGYEIIVYPDLKLWNDKSNSGLMHQNSFSRLLKTLHDNKSNYHLGKDLHFYKKYATSNRAYQTLVHKYCYYIGGFLKWKMLSLLGIPKKESL